MSLIDLYPESFMEQDNILNKGIVLIFVMDLEWAISLTKPVYVIFIV